MEDTVATAAEQALEVSKILVVSAATGAAVALGALAATSAVRNVRTKLSNRRTAKNLAVVSE